MEKNIFSPMEIDAIGEIMNISLGSSATAVSNMLDHRVDITTPQVSVIDAKDFSLGDLEPAIAVVIKYVSGLEGSNIMLLKRSDVKVIVDILMGSETPDEEFELNELTVSAVCELMNQMMGAASTALSDFLGRMVNISTPESYELKDFDNFKQEHFPANAGPIVVVRFKLIIEGALESEFLNVMSVDLARDLISSFGLGGDDEAAEPAVQEQPAAAAPVAAVPSEPAPSPAPVSTSAGPEPAAAQPAPQPAQPVAAQPVGAPAQGQTPPPAAAPGQPPAGWPQQGAYPYYYPPYPYPYPPQQAEPKVIPTKPVEMPQLSPLDSLGEEQAQNLDLILSVPLEVSVEIGRTRRKVEEILTFSKGSLVVLDKLAGDQVDLFVNGKCIARGDVVVVDDNFGVRITEILQKPGVEGAADA